MTAHVGISGILMAEPLYLGAFFVRLEDLVKQLNFFWTRHILNEISTRNAMVCLFSSDSQWFKSYGGSNIKIMAQALKMGVPRPNDIGYIGGLWKSFQSILHGSIEPYWQTGWVLNLFQTECFLVPDENLEWGPCPPSQILNHSKCSQTHDHTPPVPWPSTPPYPPTTIHRRSCHHGAWRQLFTIGPIGHLSAHASSCVFPFEPLTNTQCWWRRRLGVQPYHHPPHHPLHAAR